MTVSHARTEWTYIDLDYNNDNVFNVFYEFKNNTKFAQELVTYSNTIIELFNKYVTWDTIDGVSIYDNLISNVGQYYVYITKTNGNYSINLYYSSYGNYKYVLNYSSSGEFVNFTSEKIDYASFISFSVDPNKIVNSDPSKNEDIYKFFSFWQGNYNFYFDKSISLKGVKNDGIMYDLKGVENSWFQNIVSFFQGLSKPNYEFNENWQFDFSYYQNNLIVSKYKKIDYLRNVLFYISDYDLSGYEYVYINENIDGFYLIPKANVEKPNLTFYYYTTYVSPDLYGNVFSIDSNKDSETFGQLVQTDNYFAACLLGGEVVPISLANFYPDLAIDNKRQYVYHFFTDDYLKDVAFYYDWESWDIYIPNDNNASFQFKDDNDNTFVLTHEDADTSTQFVYTKTGKTPSLGYPSSGDGSGGGNSSGGGSFGGGSGGATIPVDNKNLSDLLSNIDIKGILKQLMAVFTAMFGFISAFMTFMPNYISQPLIFFFVIGLCVLVIKLKA